MNARVLDLLKNPENIQSGDLKLLENEIRSAPYIQNIRALYLYGTHRFNPENYQKILSETAAYTTDKKILYHFINRTSAELDQNDWVKEPVPAAEETLPPAEETAPETPKANGINKFDTNQIIEIEEKPLPKPVIVNGERNRILFEGEEDFLERPAEKIDMEATQESGTIVTESASKGEFKDPVAVENALNEKPIDAPVQEIKEEILQNEETDAIEPTETSDLKEVDDISVPDFSSKKEDASADLSFHGIETFLPDVAVPVQNKSENYQPKQAVNRHEEEMKRLIAEVEARIKAKKASQPIEEKATEKNALSNEISFAETQTFDLKKVEEETVEPPIYVPEKPAEIHSEMQKEEPAQMNPSWKPMAVPSHTLDALIQKTGKAADESPAEIPVPEKENQTSEVLDKEQPQEIKSDERPALNVSFFAPGVAKIDEEKSKKPVIEPVIEEVKPVDSNVPQFINTWQNWLKIERKEPETSKEEIKEKAIEKFIESEPKISKLKEETSFVVKEKAGDISHLMTETLARLYVEQKLYAKAIKAYEILTQKHPGKAEYFAEKIQEIKQRGHRNN